MGKRIDKQQMIEAIDKCSRVEEIVNGENSTHFQFISSIYIAEELGIAPTSVRRAIRRKGLEDYLLEVKERMLKEFHNNRSGQTCRECKTHKPFSEFHKYARIKSGYRYECKECRGDDYSENREVLIQKSKANYVLNREEIRAKAKEAYATNPEPHIARSKQYASLNTEKRRSYMKQYVAERVKTDHVFAMRKRVSLLVYSALKSKSFTKKSRTFEILGINCNGFVNHIESLFLEGMTWENRNEWHIDHIVPISFAQTEEEVIKLNHYSNLRPLWAIDNIERGNDIDKFIDHCEYSMRIVEEYKQAS